MEKIDEQNTYGGESQLCGALTPEKNYKPEYFTLVSVEASRFISCCCRSLASSKEVAALRLRETEELQQLRRQQSSLARQVRADKSMETAAKEAATAARHAAELRKVTTQRDALATAIKKQFKLIEVLKQQKAHLEAARWLQFTEEEFLKVVDAEGSSAHQQSQQA
ncbi:LOW QUALITY PROTEIN: hypothetical protein, conserved [Eimeria necatrix]|uniref:Uncharacterized protein n=1 Tax=Eimeria necatrix TaxID=51315 RepID=U6MGJ9_9EIME|nr:LOW QUALITY PROTEIN: hypothetical protein, conserved [Eimeria necatrix]CDJ63382.1 hypothetical protein, conserved [Eimeria necatrix]